MNSRVYLLVPLIFWIASCHAISAFPESTVDEDRFDASADLSEADLSTDDTGQSTPTDMDMSGECGMPSEPHALVRGSTTPSLESPRPLLDATVLQNGESSVVFSWTNPNEFQLWGLQLDDSPRLERIQTDPGQFDGNFSDAAVWSAKDQLLFLALPANCDSNLRTFWFGQSQGFESYVVESNALECGPNPALVTAAFSGGYNSFDRSDSPVHWFWFDWGKFLSASTSPAEAYSSAESHVLVPQVPIPRLSAQRHSTTGSLVFFRDSDGLKWWDPGRALESGEARSPNPFMVNGPTAELVFDVVHLTNDVYLSATLDNSTTAAGDLIRLELHTYEPEENQITRRPVREFDNFSSTLLGLELATFEHGVLLHVYDFDSQGRSSRHMMIPIDVTEGFEFNARPMVSLEVDRMIASNAVVAVRDECDLVAVTGAIEFTIDPGGEFNSLDRTMVVETARWQNYFER